MKSKKTPQLLPWLFVSLTVLILASCGNADYQKTESGLLYKVFKNGQNKKVLPGQFVKLHYRAMVGDSVLIDTYKHIPAYGQYDTTTKNVHDFVDFLGEMNIGDSVVFIRNIDTMQKRGYLMYNEAFKQGGTIKGYITILGVFRTQEAISKDQEQEAIKEKAREIVAMEQFLKDKNITGYVKTTGGVFIKLHQQGNGPKVDSGMVVSVNYTGALKNGNKFDSNVDSAYGHPGPFEFVAKGNGVIPGWDEAIVYLNKGAKATLYIPAMLAYGPNAQGDKLPAFSDLIFDIEVKDVRPNTATPAPTVQLNGQ